MVERREEYRNLRLRVLILRGIKLGLSRKEMQTVIHAETRGSNQSGKERLIEVLLAEEEAKELEKLAADMAHLDGDDSDSVLAGDESRSRDSSLTGSVPSPAATAVIVNPCAVSELELEGGYDTDTEREICDLLALKEQKQQQCDDLERRVEQEVARLAEIERENEKLRARLADLRDLYRLQGHKGVPVGSASYASEVGAAPAAGVQVI